MRTIAASAFSLLLVASASAAPIFVADYKSDADAVVYVTKYKS